MGEYVWAKLTASALRHKSGLPRDVDSIQIDLDPWYSADVP